MFLWALRTSPAPQPPRSPRAAARPRDRLSLPPLGDKSHGLARPLKPALASSWPRARPAGPRARPAGRPLRSQRTVSAFRSASPPPASAFRLLPLTSPLLLSVQKEREREGAFVVRFGSRGLLCSPLCEQRLRGDSAPLRCPLAAAETCRGRWEPRSLPRRFPPCPAVCRPPRRAGPGRGPALPPGPAAWLSSAGEARPGSDRAFLRLFHEENQCSAANHNGSLLLWCGVPGSGPAGEGAAPGAAAAGAEAGDSPGTTHAASRTGKPLGPAGLWSVW